ncbi:hypothetical protein NQ318_021111 [Aromia moschata]|uniref:Helix-turn-helix domain-containing protein n=1 Tax=Aromia moschata TaxID=1265417 RepID=A0AAV8XEK2_9CUCU|nr:hypothetical protein NQ318_021111 [Aromia moschata]
MEHNEPLPFLDVLVIRNSENKLEFDVYRKETVTLRYIPNDSHHPFQHKMASFNFLIHRLLNFPLSKERFEHEKQLIKNIAKNNVRQRNAENIAAVRVKAPHERGNGTAQRYGRFLPACQHEVPCMKVRIGLKCAGEPAAVNSSPCTRSGISQTSTWRISRRDLGLRPYKLQLTQELKVNDHRQRRLFADWASER